MTARDRNQVLVGDCRERLWGMPRGCVQCVVTSPPYWALRRYEGVEPSLWGVSDESCEHVWGPSLPKPGSEHRNGLGAHSEFAGRQDKAAIREALHGGYGTSATSALGPKGCGLPNNSEPPMPTKADAGAYCQLCGCWRGCLGLEPTPSQFVSNLVECFAAVRHVLRPDGVAWVNLGDSYAGTTTRLNKGFNARWGNAEGERQQEQGRDAPARGLSGNLKPKDLVGIPWMVAFALRDAGWYLRSAITWAKGASYCKGWSGSVMPESCRDRPTSAYEMVFLLGHPDSGGRYYYDAEAVRERAQPESIERAKYPINAFGGGDRSGRFACAAEGDTRNYQTTGTRNLRNVWAIGTAAYADAHFATYPPALVEPCIKAGTSAKGACPACGTPWRRVVDVQGGAHGQSWHDHSNDAGAGMSTYSGHPGGLNYSHTHGEPYNRRTVDWEPSCACHHPAACEICDGHGRQFINDTDAHVPCPQWTEPADPVPCLVLDPFGGSGTTAMVARRLGRDYILVDASEEYAAMARQRIADDDPAAPVESLPPDAPLFAAAEGGAG